ncbi:hypothetical protein BDZ89DRAFT_1151087 [Hymenopellis radicata]|nr:hypothetical protein BDZ89DRAFT_1151087 [Hymenopellis radicata]
MHNIDYLLLSRGWSYDDGSSIIFASTTHLWDSQDPHLSRQRKARVPDMSANLREGMKSAFDECYRVVFDREDTDAHVESSSRCCPPSFQDFCRFTMDAATEFLFQDSRTTFAKAFLMAQDILEDGERR